jgi:hypothetical protein
LYISREIKTKKMICEYESEFKATKLTARAIARTYIPLPSHSNRSQRRGNPSNGRWLQIARRRSRSADTIRDVYAGMKQSERTARQETETETDAIRPSGEMGKWGKG